MRSLAPIIALVLLTAAAASSQTVNTARLKVHGIGLDSSYAVVLKALGRPAKDGKPTREECIGGREKTVDYAGLSLYFMDGDSRGGKTFEVKSFSVTSAKWLVSGVRVGDTPAMVKAKFGSRYTVDHRTDNGGLVWQYEMNDTDGPGATAVVFKKGKIVEISTAYQVC